jgi:LysR family transcriptional regulator, nitrogen assimilation regulatory protein
VEIGLLKTFIAVYEEGSFTKAAQRLHATQPGVSVHIAALEEIVNATLFERSARSVTPTTAGERLYPRAQQLLRDIQSAQQEIRALSGKVTGNVSVGIPPALAKAILAPVVSRYVAAYPDVRVRIVDTYSDNLLSFIKRGELDLAIVGHLIDDTAITFRRVFRDRFILASGAASALAPGRVIELNVEPHFKIVIPSVLRHALHRVLDRSLTNGDIVPARLIEIDGLAGIFDFVAITDWVALIPSAASFNNFDSRGIRFNRIAGDEVTIDYFVANSRTEPISIAAQAFIDLAVEELDGVAAKWQSRHDLR